jgi:AcrR family transcriptional regulator
MSIASVAPARAKGAEQTRQAILEAARSIFSTHGYRDAGVREITSQAGVSIALVNRYFGSKERLFEEALSSTINPSPLLNVPRERYGEAIVDRLLGGGAVNNPLRMIVLASADPGSRAIAQRVLTEHVYQPLAHWFGPEEGDLRAARLMIVAAGLTLYCQVYGLDVLVPEPAPSLRAWLVHEFQSLVD